MEALADRISKIDVQDCCGVSRPQEEAKRSLQHNVKDGTTLNSLDQTAPKSHHDGVHTDERGCSQINEMTSTKDNLSTGSCGTQSSVPESGSKSRIASNGTEDTEVHTRREPAIIHETVRQDVHEIEEQHITRDIHQDHIFHRILPIEEIEVLPAKHYVQTQNGSLQEVTNQRTSPWLNKHIENGIAEGVKRALPKMDDFDGSRMFSARSFAGEEGDYKESTNHAGLVRSERWWIHAPTLEVDGVKSGQTRAFHLSSSNPDDDGLRR